MSASTDFVAWIRSRRAAVFYALYLLFLLGTGLGYIAITPPFEGFDETAHYSSLREIADTGRIPVYGRSRLDQSVEDYRGPMHYATGAPPFDVGLVYPKFFARPELIEQFRRLYREPAAHEAFRPGTQLNWQAQHPPLYYVLMANLLPALDQYSFTTQFFCLRLASLLLALGGVALGLLAVHQPGVAPGRNPALIGFALYPIMLPMFFPEFARIGNDALCLFLVGVTAVLLSAWLKDNRSGGRSIALGATLGLGLLTKAFFLPISLGVGILLACRIWRNAEASGARFEQIRRSLMVAGAALLVGGGWYVYKYVMFGDATGADYAIRLDRQGGMIAGLREHFSLVQLVRGALMPLVSFQWVGTWSVARLPEYFQVPMVLLVGAAALAYLNRIKARSVADPAWLPVWVVGLFLLGLYWHVLIGIALYNLGAAGGWYLHILLPWIAPALGLGVAGLLTWRRARYPIAVLLLYSIAFHVGVLWCQLALFTGCATKGADKYYQFSGSDLCLDQTSLVMERLAVFGYPCWAIAGFGLAIACLIGMLVQLRGAVPAAPAR
jgi:hypothetical protein